MLRDAGGDLPAAVTAPLLSVWIPPKESPAEPSPATGGLPEITDEEIDTATAACCRICLESESEPGYFVFDVCILFALFQAIAAIGGMAYLLDKDGNFRNRFSDDWERFLSKHPVPFYYCVGVVVFFVLVGFFGLIVHLSSFNNHDPCLAGFRNGCFGWGIVDLPASMEACFAFAVIFVIIFAILGVAYGFLAATLAIQRIWQRHYHILTKKELTKEDLLSVTVFLRCSSFVSIFSYQLSVLDCQVFIALLAYAYFMATPTPLLLINISSLGSGEGDELISPCMCKGTQQFVHHTCLDHWRAVKEGTAFSHCTTCKAQFHLRVEFLEDGIYLRWNSHLGFLPSQAIAAIAGVAYLLDRDGKFRNRFANDGDHILSQHPVLFYYCVGVVRFFALVGLCGLLLHFFSSDYTHPSCLAGCSYECLDCFAASGEASCLVLAIVVVIAFAIPGVIYGCIAATMALEPLLSNLLSCPLTNF
ncbi:hypothetical protein BAE44_0021426 [Dichanthelium oligosanthes]|uniref:RING-CH-type domain-containing protein n=1 Tax=Dichanthelium oligosanthes TaxID=888268 RepID=A0A1E5UXH0_9POAL|nr:hypothetical protein BAE44_0021426 [Dichanthelium oligosanthes]